MTDNEIIKDLESSIRFIKRYIRDMQSVPARCSAETIENAIDLIKRQKAEISRLRIDVFVEPLKMVTKITSYLKSLLIEGYPIVTYEFIDSLEKKMLGGHKDPVGEKGMDGNYIRELCRKAKGEETEDDAEL